jgi:hypothetical protein
VHEVGQCADLLDRLEIVIDPDAEPADFDEALAEFLLTHVRRSSASTETSVSANMNQGDSITDGR